jgi:hypothetical protein
MKEKKFDKRTQEMRKRVQWKESKREIQQNMP